MAFVVEDGTGLSGATSLASVEFADDYHTSLGNATWSADTTENKQSALNRASAWMASAISLNGEKINGRSQPMAFPRIDLVDCDGNEVDADSVPIEALKAVCEIALREMIEPGVMTPDVTLADKVKREKIGKIEVEYLNEHSGAYASRPILTIVNALLGCFLVDGSSLSGSSIFATSCRG